MKKTPIQRKPMKRTGSTLKGSKMTSKPRKVSKKGKVPGTKIWGLKRADAEISKYVRERDAKCMFPGCAVTDFARLQCSHYHGRARNSTRFLPSNLISLCKYHHYGSKLIGWEYAKQQFELHGREGEYTFYMKQFLGENVWYELQNRAAKSMKRSDAIQELMDFLKPVDKPETDTLPVVQ